MKNPIARFVSLLPGKDGIQITLRLGPNWSKDQINTWLGEEGALVGLVIPPGHIQLKPPAPKNQKGGEKCMWLGARCKEKLFQEFLLHIGLTGHVDINKQLAETNAVKAVQQACGISSRAEIDHNPEASQKFDQDIRIPFAKWAKARGH
jgi:hypothetical protein